MIIVLPTHGNQLIARLTIRDASRPTLFPTGNLRDPTTNRKPWRSMRTLRQRAAITVPRGLLTTSLATIISPPPDLLLPLLLPLPLAVSFSLHSFITFPLRHHDCLIRCAAFLFCGIDTGSLHSLLSLCPSNSTLRVLFAY